MIDRRTFLCGLSLCALTTRPVYGQVTTRRIGFLSPFSRADIDDFLSALRPELEKLGWTDGRNLMLLEPRTTEGANDRLPSAATELVAQGPDLILVQSVPATRALLLATKSIPILMVGVGNPVEAGLVADFSKPGGNVTGSSYMAHELTGKLLQLLKEAAPQLRSVAVFVNPSNDAARALTKQMRADAATYGLQAQIVEVTRRDDFEAAFSAIRAAHTQSILLPPEPLIRSKRDEIADFARKHALPLAVVGDARQLPAGGLMAYGPARGAYAQLTARYVDRILRGANPSTIPVEQPTRFHLVINLKTAKVIGLTIPQSLLLRADEVIQ